MTLTLKTFIWLGQLVLLTGLPFSCTARRGEGEIVSGVDCGAYVSARLMGDLDPVVAVLFFL